MRASFPAQCILLAGLLIHSVPPALAGDVRTITDAIGRTVSVPVNVQRIACLTGACYEKVFLLGEADKVVVRQLNFPPWLEQTNPKAKLIATITTANIEDLLSRGVQVAFSFNQSGPLTKLDSAGIPALVTTVPPPGGEDRDDFIRRTKDEVRLFGNVLGARAEAIAADWCDYYDRIVTRIVAKTDRIPPDQRPKIYYVRGPAALATHGRDSNMRWYGEMAGGDLSLARLTKPGISGVNIEDIIAWNPDVIFVGRQYPLELVTQDPRWSDIAAVKSGRVIPVPDGVFFWDSSSEGILLLAFMARTLHPNLFAELDLGHEVKKYYRRFYHYALSDAESQMLLQGRAPDGRRYNPAGN